MNVGRAFAIMAIARNVIHAGIAMVVIVTINILEKMMMDNSVVQEKKVIDKKKIKIGWKVVTKANKLNNYKLTSAFDSGKTVVYEVDKWTNQPRKCGPLTVFCTRDSALRFAWSAHSVYRCFYIRSYARHLYAHGRRCSCVLPYGTVFAKKVKLISRVHRRAL